MGVQRCRTVLLGLMILGCGDRQDEPTADVSHDEEVARVILTTEQREAAGIETVIADRRPAVGYIEATAEIVPAGDRVAKLGSRIPGRVTSLMVNVGDQVRAGQMVAIVDSPELGRAKADYLAARAEATVAREIADREAELFRERITSEREWQRAEAEAVRAAAEKEAAENRLHALGLTEDELEALETEGHFSSLMNIRPPLGGVVISRPVSLGEMIVPEDEILTILDAREVWTLIDVYDEHLAHVRLAQRVTVRTRAYPNRVFEGRVDNIGAVVEPATRSVKVRVVLPNESLELRPGMFADVQLEIGDDTADSALVVPESSVQRDGTELIVFIDVGDGAFERREVIVGETLGEWTVIVSGVEPGEAIVTTGAFVLKSELGKEDLGEHGH